MKQIIQILGFKKHDEANEFLRKLRVEDVRDVKFTDMGVRIIYLVEVEE